MVKFIKRGVAVLNRKFIPMHQLELYYLNEAGRGLSTPGIGPFYSAPLYLQRGHGLGNCSGSLFRWVRSLLWSGTNAVGRETLHNGGKILIDIAERSPTETTTVSKHMTESAQNLISKLRARGRKRANCKAVAGGKKEKRRKEPTKMKRVTRKIIKRDIFS